MLLKESHSTTATVAILMGTYNGEEFLQEQLDSITSQTISDWVIHVSDDGSTDKTVEIIQNFKLSIGEEKIFIRNGPHKGFVANFLSIACDELIKAEFYAYCDQDDIWEQDKLEQAIKWLNEVPNKTPAMYCSRTRLIDSNGKCIGFSTLFKRPPSFENALVQSIAGANTIVFNQAAKDLLIKAGANVEVPSHDWWLYLVITACSGLVKYDAYPSVRYRQHGKNLVGKNLGFRALLKRLAMGVSGTFSTWTGQHLLALEKLHGQFSDGSLQCLKKFKLLRYSNLIYRVFHVDTALVYRQTWLGNFLLNVAIILGKF